MAEISDKLTHRFAVSNILTGLTWFHCNGVPLLTTG